MQRACEKIVKFHGNWCNQKIDEKRIVFIQIAWNGNWNGNEIPRSIFLSPINSFYVQENPLNRRRNIVNDVEKNYRYV